jgi:adenylate kinase
MLSLEVEEEELINRLLNRGKKSNRSDDQDVNVIQKRLNVYKESTEPVKHYYIEKGRHRGISGMQSEEKVFDEICGILSTLNPQ